MTPTTCTGCGSPLPAFAADPRSPDRCPACVARGASTVPAPGQGSVPGWPTGPPAPSVGATPPPMITRTRAVEGLLFGLAAATLAGVAWWAVVSITRMQIAYGAIAVGVIIGQAVLIGARKGGVLPAVVAGLASLGALAVAEYFIQRSLTIAELGIDIPLWLGLSTATDIVREAVKEDPMTGLFWGIATVVAAGSAASPTRRPVI